MDVSWINGHEYDLVMKLVKKYGFKEDEAERYIADYRKAPMETVVKDIMYEEGLSDRDIKAYFEVVSELKKVVDKSYEESNFDDDAQSLDRSIMNKVQSHHKRLAEMVLSTTTMLVVDIKPFIDEVKQIRMDVTNMATDEHNIRSFYHIKKEGDFLTIVIANELYSSAMERYEYLKNGKRFS